MLTKSLMACLVLGIILAMSFAAESEALTVRDASDHETDTLDDTQMPDNAPTENTDNNNNDDDDADDTPLSFRGFGRFLSSSKKKSPKSMTCDKYPKVCRAKGSKAKDCCKKKCVCKETDKQNCGKCGKKCKFGQACCKGKCINTMTDSKNCGGCNYKCAKGRKCRYGMCSYAYY